MPEDDLFQFNIQSFPPPRVFSSIDEFEIWLRDDYRVQSFIRCTACLYTLECWGIFSSDGRFEHCYEAQIPTLPDKTLIPKLTSEIENDLRGKILSHNHPSDSTFSIQDVYTWANLQMSEIRAVTTEIRYSIKPVNGLYPPLKSIEQLYKEEHDIEKCIQILAHRGLILYLEIPWD